MIEKLRNEFADTVEFYGIDDEEKGTIKSFLKKTEYGFTVLMDGSRVVHRKFNVRAIPTMLVVDRDGVIRHHFVGTRDEASLRKAIQNALRGS